MGKWGAHGNKLSGCNHGLEKPEGLRGISDCFTQLMNYTHIISSALCSLKVRRYNMSVIHQLCKALQFGDQLKSTFFKHCGEALSQLVARSVN